MKCLDDVKKTLLTVSDKVWHYYAPSTDMPYIVWAEDGGGRQANADNRVQIQAIQGSIDYYTKNEKDPNIEKIPNALNAFGISFYLNTVQYEDETKTIHYEWVFEVS